MEEVTQSQVEMAIREVFDGIAGDLYEICPELDAINAVEHVMAQMELYPKDRRVLEVLQQLSTDELVKLVGRVLRLK